MSDKHAPQIVGLGEVLWDMLPNGAQLGGAPTNFAVGCARLGAHAALASAVGSDRLGEQTRALLSSFRVDTSFLQQNELPTGEVTVEVDSAGQPHYTIAEPSAWDSLQWTSKWQALAQRCDAVCFGTLALREPRSRQTIRSFVETTKPECVRVFDVNLRPPFYDADAIRWGLHHATILKLNDDELAVLEEAAGISQSDAANTLHSLLRAWPSLALVCLTHGARGCSLLSREERAAHGGFAARVADTVGAGDAFTAAAVTYFLRKAPLAGIAAAANRLGAYVASQPGATPALSPELLAELDTLAGG